MKLLSGDGENADIYGFVCYFCLNMYDLFVFFRIFAEEIVHCTSLNCK